METDAAVEIRTRRGFPQLLENSLGDSAFSQLPQARRRAKYQPISTAAIHLKNRDFLSEEWGAPHPPLPVGRRPTVRRPASRPRPASGIPVRPPLAGAPLKPALHSRTGTASFLPPPASDCSTAHAAPRDLADTGILSGHTSSTVPTPNPVASAGARPILAPRYEQLLGSPLGSSAYLLRTLYP